MTAPKPSPASVDQNIGSEWQMDPGSTTYVPHRPYVCDEQPDATHESCVLPAPLGGSGGGGGEEGGEATFVAQNASSRIPCDGIVYPPVWKSDAPPHKLSNETLMKLTGCDIETLKFTIVALQPPPKFVRPLHDEMLASCAAQSKEALYD